MTFVDRLKAYLRDVAPLFERFQAKRHLAAQLYNERFCRMWEFYLAACEMTFRNGPMMVFQIQLARRRDAVPLTRNYITDLESRNGPYARGLAEQLLGHFRDTMAAIVEGKPIMVLGGSIFLFPEGRPDLLHTTAGAITDLAPSLPHSRARVAVAHVLGLDVVDLQATRLAQRSLGPVWTRSSRFHFYAA